MGHEHFTEGEQVWVYPHLLEGAGSTDSAAIRLDVISIGASPVHEGRWLFGRDTTDGQHCFVRLDDAYHQIGSCRECDDDRVQRAHSDHGLARRIRAQGGDPYWAAVLKRVDGHLLADHDRVGADALSREEA